VQACSDGEQVFMVSLQSVSVAQLPGRSMHTFFEVSQLCQALHCLSVVQLLLDAHPDRNTSPINPIIANSRYASLAKTTTFEREMRFFSRQKL